jgi:anti-anti-sigma regulatory factor
LILTNLHPFVENIIDMTGFTQMLKIANSEEEALDILKE